MDEPTTGGLKEAESKLRESEARFRLLLDSIRDYAIFMLDAGGHISTWNPGAQRFKGYEAHEIIGKHFSTFYPADDVAAGKCERELQIATETGRFEEEGWRIRKDGSRFWANVVISAIHDNGQIVGFAKVTRDLTERRRAEEERAQLVAAELANRTKDEFLAILSHELRNPLAPIVTALELMKARDGEAVSRERVIIERQVQHMVRLVDDLLDVSRISQGKVDLKRERVELFEAAASAIEVARPLMEQRKHQLTVDVPKEGLPVLGDLVRLSQVIANLLTNAGKYTEPGGRITLSAARHGSEVELRVSDNGVGISRELLPRIFDSFVQAPRPVDRSAGGLGIGLTLVRSLVQLHGGSVTAQSEGLGAGSTFVVRLPIEEMSAETGGVASVEAKTSSASRRVLVVDDNVDGAELLGDLLRTRGHEVRIAHEGNAAVAILASFSPDVAILDIGLPGMDGYELARRIADRLGAHCRLIALTGYGRPEDRHRSRSAGFHRHLIKPVDPTEVLQLVATGPSAG